MFFSLTTRDRWSEDLESHRHLSSDDHSDKELEAKGSEEDEDKEDGEEEHVYQTLYRRESTKEPIYALPPKPVVSASDIYFFKVHHLVLICFSI